MLQLLGSASQVLASATCFLRAG